MGDINYKVVILIIAHKSELSHYESISLIQCSKILGRYKTVFICPEGLDVSIYKKLCPTASFDFIDPKWQSNYDQFNRLKIDRILYKKYQLYKFILFYEPDAFVFKDELEEWCNKDYDYIGAPWVKGFEKGTSQSPFLGVGNGGFSLRKVASHLKALHSFSYCIPLSKNWNDRFVKKRYGNNFLKHVAGILSDYTFRNNTFWAFNNYLGNEDRFWGLAVARNFKWFRVPSIETAARFSIEMQPKRFYELNNLQLPFGCHAWWKYDLEFWKPHIEKLGFRISNGKITTENQQEDAQSISH